MSPLPPITTIFMRNLLVTRSSGRACAAPAAERPGGSAAAALEPSTPAAAPVNAVAAAGRCSRGLDGPNTSSTMSQHASNGLWQQLGDFLADVPQAVATHL